MFYGDSGADHTGHGGGHMPPLLQMAGHGGTVSTRTAYKKTDQTVLTITKALTITTNFTGRAKKVEGTAKKKISGAGPHFQIRSGATVVCMAIIIVYFILI